MSEKDDGLDALKRECLEAAGNPSFSQSIVNAVIDHLAQRGMILQEGWVAVPREPTEDMLEEASFSFREAIKNADPYKAHEPKEMRKIEYRAMLAAAPKLDEIQGGV